MKTTSANRPYDIISNIIYFEGMKECVFVNSALKIQYHIIKNTLLQLLLSRRFCPLRREKLMITIITKNIQAEWWRECWPQIAFTSGKVLVNPKLEQKKGNTSFPTNIDTNTFLFFDMTRQCALWRSRCRKNQREINDG